MASTPAPVTTSASSASLYKLLCDTPEEDRISQYLALSGKQQRSVVQYSIEKGRGVDEVWVPGTQHAMMKQDWWLDWDFSSLEEANKWPYMDILRSQMASFPARSEVVKNVKLHSICGSWPVSSPADVFKKSVFNGPSTFSTKMLQTLASLAKMCPGETGMDQVVGLIDVQCRTRIGDALYNKDIKLSDVVQTLEELKGLRVASTSNHLVTPPWTSEVANSTMLTPPKTPYTLKGNAPKSPSINTSQPEVSSNKGKGKEQMGSTAIVTTITQSGLTSPIAPPITRSAIAPTITSSIARSAITPAIDDDFDPTQYLNGGASDDESDMDCRLERVIRWMVSRIRMLLWWMMKRWMSLNRMEGWINVPMMDPQWTRMVIS